MTKHEVVACAWQTICFEFHISTITYSLIQINDRRKLERAFCVFLTIWILTTLFEDCWTKTIGDSKRSIFGLGKSYRIKHPLFLICNDKSSTRFSTQLKPENQISWKRFGFYNLSHIDTFKRMIDFVIFIFKKLCVKSICYARSQEMFFVSRSNSTDLHQSSILFRPVQFAIVIEILLNILIEQCRTTDHQLHTD